MKPARRPSTAAARTGLERDQQHGAVMPPIHLSANFTFEAYGCKRRYDYTRSGNPTRDLLAEALAELEGGAGSIVTSSGMSAVHLVLQLLRPGDLLIAPHDCYGGTFRLMRALAERGSLRVRFVEASDPVRLGAALEEQPAMLWIETPSNPLLRITDIETAAMQAHERGTLVAVDNTFLSPALQRPLEQGADIVVHSTTKYINGHSDVVGGAVCARSRENLERLEWWANCLGVTGAPFDSWLSLRGLRTLHVRIRQQEANAAAIVERLQAHPMVDRVHWPGLPAHPGHAIARRQQSGFGGIVSFELVDVPGAVKSFLEELRHFSLAESLGGVESLVAHPATMTHAAMGPQARAAAGIGDRLLRFSIGIEDAGDLLEDLDAALERVAALSSAGREALAPHGNEPAQHVVAQHESPPEQDAEADRKQDLEPALLRAHVGRHGATQIAGQQDGAENGSSGDQIDDRAGQQHDANADDDTLRISELDRRLDDKDGLYQLHGPIENQEQRRQDTEDPAGQQPRSRG